MNIWCYPKEYNLAQWKVLSQIHGLLMKHIYYLEGEIYLYWDIYEAIDFKF